MADVLFAIGGSSFSGNAAAVHAGVTRVPWQGHHVLGEADVEALRAAFGPMRRG